METRVLIAFAAGYNAAELGKSRAPAQSSIIENMIYDNRKVGESDTIALLDAFALGYQKQCDEEAAAILAA